MVGGIRRRNRYRSVSRLCRDGDIQVSRGVVFKGWIGRYRDGY